MKAKQILLLVGLAALVLFLSGCVTGAIGSVLVGRESLLPVPGVHLPPQQILNEQAGANVSSGFALTNTMLSSFITTIVLLLLFVLGTSKLKIVPGRLQSLLEMIVEGALSFIEAVAGKDRARQLLPVIATIFLFVLFNAWLGLIPIYQSFGYTRYSQVTLADIEKHYDEFREVDEKTGLKVVTAEELTEAHLIEHGTKVAIVPEGTLTRKVKVEANRFEGNAAGLIKRAGGEAEKKDAGLSATFLRPAGTDMNMPLALAIISFVFVEGLGIRRFGFNYFAQFFPFLKANFSPIGIFVGILELLSHFIRVVSFTFRLFGNMTAGEILLLVSAFLASFVFTVMFYGLELLVGLIQAVIFAGLTLVFAAVALTPHEGEGHEEHH